MYAWKSAFILSVFSFSTAFASPSSAVAAVPSAGSSARSAIPITKADVYGFWSMSVDVGLDIHLQIETFFSADGSYEGRAFIDNEGEIQRLHEFGTWSLAKDTIRTFTDLSRCKSEGDLVEGCDQVDGDPVTVAMVDGSKTLLLEDGEETGTYAGAVKMFTLPDLLKASALARRSGSPQGNGSRRLQVRFPGNGSEILNGAGKGFDVSGRYSSARAAAGFFAR